MSVCPTPAVYSAIDTPIASTVLPRLDHVPAARGRVLAWVVPDLALTFALLTLLSLFVMFHGSTVLFGDTDAGWHIRNGERIIATGTLPHVDPFSFSNTGKAWVAWEWGADVLVGAVHSACGLGGVALFYGLLIAGNGADLIASAQAGVALCRRVSA